MIIVAICSRTPISVGGLIYKEDGSHYSMTQFCCALLKDEIEINIC